MKKQIFSALKVSALALALSFGMSYALAWTPPNLPPPQGNIAAPINDSLQPQTKAGNLSVGNLCLSGVCNSSWPPGATISGSGTTGNVVKWTNSTTLGNSQIVDNGTNVGIGTANPLSTLSVGGSGVAAAGVSGAGATYGVYGSSAGYGVYGASSANVGVYGLSYNSTSLGYGVYGSSPNVGVGAISGNVGISAGGGNIGGTFITGVNGYNLHLPARNDVAHGVDLYSALTYGVSTYNRSTFIWSTVVSCPFGDQKISQQSVGGNSYVVLCAHTY